jgi:hypothetical protein
MGQLLLVTEHNRRARYTYSAAVEAAVVVDSIRLAVVASMLVPMTSAAVMTLNQNFFCGF